MLQQQQQRQSPTVENDDMVDESNDLSKLSLPTLLSLTKNNSLGQLINNNLNKQLASSSSSSINRTQSTTDLMSRDNSESKRSRTQLTNGQVNAMQATFDLYRSPSLAECEILGAGIGLARRVVQVKIRFFNC